ncbi:hypothetical protein DV736_g1946, partial [Chaetothyriales sp. CBS 134916]
MAFALNTSLPSLTALPSVAPDALSSISGALHHPLKTIRRYRLNRTRSLDSGAEQFQPPDPAGRGCTASTLRTARLPRIGFNRICTKGRSSVPVSAYTCFIPARSWHNGAVLAAVFGDCTEKGAVYIGSTLSHRAWSCLSKLWLMDRAFHHWIDYGHVLAQAAAKKRNALAHAERTANSNPTSATAQNAFYQALLRANMPKIVIERYQTGRYASNAAADAAYLKSLQMTGSVPAPGSVSAEASNGSVLSQSQLQAVGQAVAGQSIGAGSVVRPGTRQGTGAKETPLYVVVEESWGSTIFRWAKMLLWTGLVGYFILVMLTMVAEFGGSLRTRVGQNNEVQPQHQTVRFSDVHGCDEAKEELQELVEFLMNPEKFNQLGGKLPKGVLLVGPPGTGKTMLARAVAGEAGCPVFYMSGSEFDELYVGVGAKRVRDLFAQARNKAPSIIFIDELDAVGSKRNARDPAYAKQTLNQLLTELDGFSPSTGVILIAATNYPESLDKALTRPGRFDRHVNVPLPDVRGRIQILKHHMRNVPVASDVDATTLARGTSGFSGADLENLVNQAAVHASRQKLKKVNMNNFEWAKDKIMMGAESKSRLIREKDKIMTAYHEAGHCLVNLNTPSSDDLYKMTIIPRGRALGVTHMLPEMDAVSRGYDQYLASIDVCMGGRAAEELIYGPSKVTSGIAHDVQSATQIAYHLITQCGYSKKLGNVDLASDYERLSGETKQEIEKEVREIVEGGRARADKIISEHRKELEMLKDALLEYETLTKEEILKVIKGDKLKRIEPETREEEKDSNVGGRANKPPETKKKHESSSKGGMGIKLPEVLLPPGTTGNRGGEAPRAREASHRPRLDGHRLRALSAAASRVSACSFPMDPFAAVRARPATPFRLDEGFSEDTSSHEEAPRMAALQEYVGSLSEDSRMEVAFEILQTLRAANIATVVERLAPYLHLDPMVKLPPEITAQVFEHLDAATLLNASLASHTWRNRILDTELWKRLYANQGWGADARQLHAYHDFQEHPRPTVVDARGRERLNWAFLYKQRQRLELNWTKGHFINFQLPDPAFPQEAHTECVYTIHFVGKWLVSGSRDKTLRIWDLETRRLVRPPLTGHTQSVLCLQFDPSPEEDIIISGSTDSSVIIWRFSTGQKLHEIPNAHSESVLNLRFNHRYLVTCSKDKKIKIWNRQPLSPLSADCPRICRSTDAVRVLDQIIDWACQDPSTLETKLANGAIKAMPAYQLLMTFVGHGAAINAIQIADDIIVSASGDRLIKIWNVNTGQMMRSIPGHQKGIACVQFDSKRIVSGSSDNTVRIFDPVTGAEVAELKGHSNLVRTLQAGFGDLPGSDKEDFLNARAADEKHAADLREGRILATARSTVYHLRNRDLGQDISSSRLSFGARLPPGGGGSKWGKIVSGSYDESIIIWRKNVAGDWVVGLKLQQDQAMRDAHRSNPLRILVPQASAPATLFNQAAFSHNPSLSTVDVAGPATANVSVSVQAVVNAAVSTGVATPSNGLSSIIGAARNRETSNTLSTASSAARSLHSSATASSAARINNSTTPVTQQQGESQAQDQPAPNHQVPTQPAPVPPLAPGAPNHHAATVQQGQQQQQHGGGVPAARVFKLQFDARRIVCCSQDSSIVCWDFANGDAEIEDACKFFTGP